jgi:catechol 2,3-dioxygenase-like lactoylglutathione lyase family enzyme
MTPMTPIATFALVALDCVDPHRLAAFYSAITGWPIVTDEPDWIVLGNPGGATLAFQLAIDHVPPVWPDPDHPQQAHLDFDVDDLVVATERVLALGARRADVQPDPSFVVFIDPAGHPFCFVRASQPT